MIVVTMQISQWAFNRYLKQYENTTNETQLKMKNLLKMNIILLFAMVFATIFRLFYEMNVWSLRGYLFSIVVLLLSNYSIRIKQPDRAVFLYISITLTLITYSQFIVVENPNQNSIRLIFQLVAMENTAILLTGLVALNRNQILFHGVICNFMFLYAFHQMAYITADPIIDISFYFIIGLVLLNMSIWGSQKIHFTMSYLLQKINQEKDEKIKALTQVVQGYIPICASCKSIRNNENIWTPIEGYLMEKSNLVEFTHSLCPKCIKKLYPDLQLDE